MNIVTAASSNHFKSCIQLLKSVPSDFKKTFYDIGLTEEESKFIKEKFDIDYRKFDFSKYPDFVNLTSQDAGAYAWKPIIVSEMYNECDGILLWCDSGNILNNEIFRLVDIIKSSKIYTPFSSGTLQRWTHPLCLKNMNVPIEMLSLQMRNAACVGFLCKDMYVKQFVDEWKELSLIKENSLPEGANRNNHRHDQSILSVLYYKYNNIGLNNYIGFTTHNDIP
jgi:hypothetical protein